MDEANVSAPEVLVGAEGFEPTTRGLRIRCPVHKTPINTRLSAVPAEPLTENLTETAPDLAEIIAAWPKLPEPLKADILAMVKASVSRERSEG